MVTSLWTRSFQLGLISLLPLFVVACAAGPEDESYGCETFEITESSVDGAVAIGLGDAHGFESVDNDGSFELELGIQGGWMARPALRIDAAALGADDESCVWVSIDARVDGMSQPISVLDSPSFRFQDGMGYSDPLNVLLSFDLEALEGRPATLEVTVQGPSAAATTAVDVTLVNAE